MNHLFRFLFLMLLLPCFVVFGGVGQQMSVHEMFKDLTEEEMVELMEIGQREMERIMTTASPEERAQYMAMMEETMANFTEDDLAEIEKIVKVVEPLLVEKESEPIKSEPVKVEPAKKAEQKEVAMSGDSSFEYTLHRIHKTINGILLKAKSDRTLTDILNKWNKRDDFNELVRLLQVLNKKELIAKLTTGKTDDIKKLLETIENFGKRLEIENKQFTVADTFGLEVDVKTSAANAAKFNKILEFFAGATETLLPMIVKFIQEFEPEALKMVKAHDDKAKTSLEAAKKIESQKRPAGGYARQDNNPSYGSNNNYNPSRNDNESNRYSHDGSPQSRRAQNKMNAGSDSDKSAMQMPTPDSGPADKSVKNEADKQKDKNLADQKDKEKKGADSYKAVIGKIEHFDDMIDASALKDYSDALNKASNLFAPFSSIDTTNIRGSFVGPLTKEQDDADIMKSQSRSAQFKQITQAAHNYYADLKPLIDDAKSQIEEIKSVVKATRDSLSSMNLQDLEKLNVAPSLKQLKAHFQSYETSFRNVQQELKNKFVAYKVQFENEEDLKSFNDLQAKIESLHGLDKTIDDARTSLKMLDRSIDAEIKRCKRDANKPQ